MAKFDDAQTITGEVNVNYVLTAYSKKLTSVMGENILLQAKLSKLRFVTFKSFCFAVFS